MLELVVLTVTEGNNDVTACEITEASALIGVIIKTVRFAS